MSYATPAELRAYLPQAPTGADGEELLQDLLDRATAIVEAALGFRFEGYAAAAARDLQAGEGRYFRLPAHLAGSVTAVARVFDKGRSSESTEAVTDYTELESGDLYREDGWEDAWYRVTAQWGYGPPPADLVETVLEVAVNLFRSRDAGRFTNVVGVEGGGAVGYEGALTPQQRMIIKQARYRVQRPFR